MLKCRLEIESQEQALDRLERSVQEMTRKAHEAEQQAKTAQDALKVCALLQQHLAYDSKQIALHPILTPSHEINSRAFERAGTPVLHHYSVLLLDYTGAT